ncbi:hypothetical protein [Acidithiobacillus sp.]|uniref:hypothetical protein n=1 Tax=Acidithiobacillus sp. TaxID=1872118 RepID=UPI0025C06F08|nr:hypothetical protein [Acidithiobacillus sp.]
MPRPALSYPVRLEPLSDFYLLSPWSLSEMARRFGLGRSNLMGLLRGERTISNAKLLELLRWSGLEVVEGDLRLAPGVHVWRVASAKHREALLRLPKDLRPEDAWDLVTESDRPRREWIHVLSHPRDARQVLLSLRPDHYPVLRDRWPGLGRHGRLLHFAEGKKYDEIAGQLGGERLYLPLAQGALLFTEAKVKEGSVAPEIDEWARWLRQTLYLDTSPWLLPELAAEATPGEGPSPSVTPVDPDACQRAWAALSHRLDLGGAHADTCDVPVFPLGDIRQYPVGMVRLDRSFLGDRALEYGKAQRLRFYRDEHTRVLWLILLEQPCPCGLPNPVPADGIGDLVLMRQGTSLQVGRASVPGQPILGRVLSRMENGGK